MRVSAIIPHHNDRATIERAVRSVLQQAHVKEVFVIDDASPDRKARSTAQSMTRLDPRVRHVQLDANVGQAAVRNYGAHLASGEFVVFLDADDEHLAGFY
jgi:glycosyltransferase involved in cell wall biosynthesis